MSRGNIRLLWIVTCGRCPATQEFTGLQGSGSQAALKAGWGYATAHGYCCPKCVKEHKEKSNA